MHRSGTSALTGILQQAGVYLGDVSLENTDNQKGNRESTDIMCLHNDILRRNHGTWENPPEKILWDPIHYSMRNLIIRQLQSQPIWGFKDPRTILTLSPWLKALPCARLVGIFRHPANVALSLQTRSGMELTEGLNLWIIYNRILLWHRKNTCNFPILEFTDQSTEFFDNVATLLRCFGLSFDGLSFYDKKLQHEKTIDLSELQVYKHALRIYENLKTEMYHSDNLPIATTSDIHQAGNVT